MKIYRVHCMESERGWGQEHWYEDFPSVEEARAYYEEILLANAKMNAGNMKGRAPDYYIQANRIETIEIDDGVVSRAK